MPGKTHRAGVQSESGVDEGVSPAGRTMPRASEYSRDWTLDPRVVFLNHGSFGACPRVVLAKQREIQDMIEREPVRFFVECLEPMLDETRAALAGLLGCEGAGLAMVPNATAGVNTVLSGLELAPGDELLTSTQEYNACNNALRRWGEARGAQVVCASVGFPISDEGEVIESVMRRVTGRTRLALISHVTSPTGLVMPVNELTWRLQARGVRVLIDGAHAPGMVPLNLAALNAEYYTGNLHKWLCTPKGCAFLHVREDLRETVRPLVTSHGYNTPRTDRSRYQAEFGYTGTWDASAFLSVQAALEFLGGLMAGGLEGVMRHNREQALSARRVVCDALKQPAAAPDSMIGALATVCLPMTPGGPKPSHRGYHDRLADRLIERHGIQVPVMYHPGHAGELMTERERPASTRLLRVAMQAYNSIEQVEYLRECLIEELEREQRGLE